MKILRHSFLCGLLSLWVSGLITTAHAHRFYSTLTHVHILEDQQTVQIMHHIAGHDYYDYLNRNASPMPELEDKKYETILKDYINQSFFLLDAQEKPIKLNWAGFHFENKDLVALQEYRSETPIAALRLYNQILQDTFPKQINHTNIEFMGDTTSYNSRDHSAVIQHSLIAVEDFKK